MKVIVIDTIHGGGPSKSLFEFAAVVRDFSEITPELSLPEINFFMNLRQDGLDINPREYFLYHQTGIIHKCMVGIDCLEKKNAEDKLDAFILKNFNLNDGKRLVVAGKNPYIDLAIIKKKLSNSKFGINSNLYDYKLVDPANYYIDFRNDIYSPDIKQCMERIGVTKNVKINETKNVKTTSALDNCYKIIKLIEEFIKKNETKSKTDPNNIE